jgi:hypothetical protein
MRGSVRKSYSATGRDMDCCDRRSTPTYARKDRRAVRRTGPAEARTSLRKPSQIERRQTLLDLLGASDTPHPVLFSEHLIGDGHQMFEQLNWKAIISKRQTLPIDLVAMSTG